MDPTASPSDLTALLTEDQQSWTVYDHVVLPSYLTFLVMLPLLALCLLAYRLIKHRGHAKPRQDCLECEEEKQNTLVIINKAAKKLLWKETMRKEYYEQLV